MTQIVLKTVLTLLIAMPIVFAIQWIWKPTNQVDLMGWLRKPVSALPIVQIEPPPSLEITIVSEPSYFSEGVTVGDLEWKEWMRRCYFEVRNSGQHKIENLQIEMDMPAAIMDIKERHSRKCVGSSAFQPFKPEGIVMTNGKTTPLETFGREFEVGIGSMAPGGAYRVGLVLDRGNAEGEISLSCVYQNGKKTFAWRSEALLPPNAFTEDPLSSFGAGNAIVEYHTDESRPVVR